MKSLKQLGDEYLDSERVLPDFYFEDFMSTKYEIGVLEPGLDTTPGDAQIETPVLLKKEPPSSGEVT